MHDILSKPGLSTNAERIRAYKARKRSRGAVRLDVWISGRAARNLRAMNAGSFGETLGETLERLLRRRLSGGRNFRDAFAALLDSTDR